MATETAALSVGRANGKTTICSALAVAALDGPLAEPRGETIIVASSFDQARIAFEHVLGFMGERLAERKRWRVSDTSQSARIQCRLTGTRLRCISSDPRRAHGLAPSLVLADEPAQWPPGTGERMVAALRTAAGKQPASRFIALGTRPADPGHWFAKMLEGGAGYAQCHAAGPEDPPFQRRTWRKANPSLDHMPDLEAAIRREAAEARRDPSMLAAFRALRLNLGTADTERAALLDAGVWASIEGDAPPAGFVVWGVDLGSSAAQSAVAGYWPATGRLEALAAFPAVPGLEERGLRDGVGGLYRDMARRGELITRGERTVPVGELLAEAAQRWGAPAAIASDRWRQAELEDALHAGGLPTAWQEWRGQGFRDGGEDVRAFRRACLNRRVVPVPSLLLRSAMSEAVTISDPAANAKLAKGAEGGRRFRARDDAAAAAILAVALGARMAALPMGPPAPVELVL